MTLNWDDLRYFLAIARDGSLSAAARKLKVTQPTVGRRLKGLEDILGERLFDRTPDGFVLTNAASELVAMAEAMEKSAAQLSRRRAGAKTVARGTVRLSMWEALAQFLCAHLPELRRRLPEIDIELAVNHLDANLSRLEADLLIRECLPDNPALVARRLSRYTSAIYGARQYVAKHPHAQTKARFQYCDWVGYDEEHAYFQNQKWLLQRLGDRLPSVRANNTLVLHEAVRAGAGLGVMACFAGDNDPALVRLSDPVPEIETDLHLVVHRDLRRSAPVRAMMDALYEIFKSQEPALMGFLAKAA